LAGDLDLIEKDEISYMVLYLSDMGSYLASGLWFFEISTCRNSLQRIHSGSGNGSFIESGDVSEFNGFFTKDAA